MDPSALLYLSRADTDGLLADDPSDALQQGRRGQGAIVRPVVQGPWQECGGVKVRKGILSGLQNEGRRNRGDDPQSYKDYCLVSVFRYPCLCCCVQGRRGQPYLVLDAIKSIQQLLELRIVCTNLSGK